MCLSVQGKGMMENRHCQGFRLASLPLVLLSQPVLCPLMPEGLGMAFLAVFLAVSMVLGTWWDSVSICGIVSYQFSCLLLVTQKVNNKNVQVLNVLKFEVISSLKVGTSILVEKVITLLMARNCLLYIYLYVYIYMGLPRWY